MNTISIQYYKTNIGELILGSFEDKVCLIDYRYRKMRSSIDKRIQHGLQAKYIEQNNELLRQTRIQIDEYLEGTRKEFDLPIITVGTDFQKAVWEKLMNIKYGRTISYLELSNELNNAKAIRAVASANGANAISLIIPCHRVIGSDRKLVGYGGGVPIKKRLLILERDHSDFGDTLF